LKLIPLIPFTFTPLHLIPMTWPGPAFTAVQIPPVPERLRYADKIMMIGSCFAEHIANRLDQYKYEILQNPYGILYNPVSMAESLRRIADKKYYTAGELVYHEGLYHSLDHHGSFSGLNEGMVLDFINETIDSAYAHLSNSQFIFISPGTTWVYQYNPTGRIVGNCHKIPQTHFTKFKLTIEETEQSFEEIYQLVKRLSPSAHLIWTVSPVRHTRDSLIDNQRSKAALTLAAESMITNHPDCHYFPAYEIMMDQLRDYRYYAGDLIHPSETAIDIIWDHFSATYVDQNERKVHDLIDQINQSMNHRFLHARSDAISEFAKKQLELIGKTHKLVPGLDFSKETRYFTALIMS
ncbi:MAG TPA: GSCFA domain-containing protein, partial [Saprospiraceae bacterium]|nr:GSCFA domain-containing protein [Saprospiraceae bacterium]